MFINSHIYFIGIQAKNFQNYRLHFTLLCSINLIFSDVIQFITYMLQTSNN